VAYLGAQPHAINAIFIMNAIEPSSAVHMSGQPVVRLDMVREALRHIPPEIDRDTWLGLAAVIKSEFGPAGFEVWHDYCFRLPWCTDVEMRDAWGDAYEHSILAISMVFRLAMEFGYSGPVDMQDLHDGQRLFARLGGGA
jgi:Primase C terminal 2 (PriCT-2)